MTVSAPEAMRALSAGAALARTLCDEVVDEELAWIAELAARYGVTDLAARLADELGSRARGGRACIRAIKAHAVLGQREAVAKWVQSLRGTAFGDDVAVEVAAAWEKLGDPATADAWLSRLEDPSLVLADHALIAAGRGASGRAEALAERVGVYEPEPEQRASLKLELAGTRPGTDPWAVALRDEAWRDVLGFDAEWRASLAVDAAIRFGEAGWGAENVAVAAAVARDAYDEAYPREPRMIDWAQKLAHAFGLAGMAEHAAEVIEDYRQAFHGYGVPSEHAEVALLWALAGDEEEAENHCWSTARFAKQRDESPDHRRLAEARARIRHVDEALDHASAIEDPEVSLEVYLDLARIFHQAAVAEARNGDGVADTPD